MSIAQKCDISTRAKSVPDYQLTAVRRRDTGFAAAEPSESTEDGDAAPATQAAVNQTGGAISQYF
jgi:hypothetical protein